VSAWLRRPEARLRLAAVEALGATGSPLAIPALRPILEDADPVVAAAAAGALGTLGDAGAAAGILALARREVGNAEVAPALAEALGALRTREALPELRTWLAQPGEATRVAAAAALAAITGAPVPVPRVERAEAAPEPPPVAPGTRLRLETIRGPITLALLGSEAPRTAANLVALARRGFLDGLTFHRIVPDFVAQGGDPRGDGEGGPGFSLRCEINRHPYRRGAVGMALSGKDTGGSQFFLTLAPQPHLEGRYTVFAEVIEGLERADALLEGDAITRAVVLEP
jgi:cyclophilin family peptidyl-prolyl cis-trans isomerase